MKSFIRTISLSLLYLACLSHPLKAQDDIDYAAELAKLEAELDSLSIFTLIDSVLQATYTPPTDLIFRFGYSSNMVNAGRNYGIDQYGLTPGVSFYHKSGFYADYSGYWNSAYDPKYTVSMLSAGYLGSVKNKLTYSANYERWLYNPDHTELADGFKNNLGGYLSYNFNHLYVGLDYSYLFNQNKSANRLIGSISGQFSFKDVWIFDRISILPTIATVYGNDDVTIYYDGSLVDDFRSDLLLNDQFDGADFRAFLQTVQLTPEEEATIATIQSAPRLGERMKRKLIMDVYLSNADVQAYLYDLLDQVENQYGIMSYNFTLPVSLSIKNWSLMISYTYALPQTLPGETYNLDPIDFISTTISYRFRISSNSR